MVLLRSPRAHVLSMFKECRFDGWGIKIWSRRAAAGLPAVPHNSTHEADFEAWVDHYLHPRPTTDFLGCYHPWNFQARTMQADVKNPHNIIQGDFEPSFDRAMTNMLAMSWVGLVDFYHESKCLLVHRLNTSHSYMEGCGCDAGGGSLEVKTTDNHYTHGAQPSRIPLPPALEQKIDRISVVDKVLFSVALRGLFAEVKELEASLGRRVLCNETLHRARDDLRYVTDVVELYDAVAPYAGGGGWASKG